MFSLTHLCPTDLHGIAAIIMLGMISVMSVMVWNFQNIVMLRQLDCKLLIYLLMKIFLNPNHKLGRLSYAKITEIVFHVIQTS